MRGYDFRRVVRTGRRAGGPLAVVHRAKPEADVSRFGFIVSKQVGNAVPPLLARRIAEVLASGERRPAVGTQLPLAA